MRGLTAISLLGIVSLASGWQWQTGKEHVFEYSGRLLTGVPELQAHYAGLGIKCHVTVQVKSGTELRLALSGVAITRVNDVLAADPATGSTNWRHVKLPAAVPPPQKFKAILESPVSFSLLDGEVRSVAASKSEPVWSINIKKALIALFQAKGPTQAINVRQNMAAKGAMDSMWRAVESCVYGRCVNFYQLNELPEYIVRENAALVPFPEACSGSKYFEVIKTEDTEKSEKTSVFSFIKPAEIRCKGGKCDANIARSSSTRYIACGSTAQNLILQTVINEGELSQNLMFTKAENFVTGTKQIIKLKTIKAITTPIPEPADPFTAQSLDYIFARSQTGTVTPMSAAELQRQQVAATEAPARLRLALPRGLATAAPDHAEFAKMMSAAEITPKIIKLFVEVVSEMANPVERHCEQHAPDCNKQTPLKLASIARGVAMLSAAEIAAVHAAIAADARFADKVAVTGLFADVAMMAGTVPAVDFIVKLIEGSKVSTLQTASTFMFLTHYIATPTQPLLAKLLAVVKSPAVHANVVVRNNAILGFGNLVQKACLDENRKAAYPTNVFGDFCGPNSPVVAEWIDFLATELKTVTTLSHKNLAIVALGQLSHKAVVPILISLIEKPSNPEPVTSASHIHPLSRYIAVYALTNAGIYNHAYVTQVLNGVFSNPAENTEIRIAAFNAILKLDPPMSLLQHIVASTWAEKDTEVLKTINTALLSLVYEHSREPAPPISEQTAALHKKVAILVPLMKRVPGIYPTSAVIFTGDYMPQLGIGYADKISWAGGQESVVPSDLYAKMDYILGAYKFTPFEAAVTTTGIETISKQLMQLLTPREEGQTMEQQSNAMLQKVKSQLHAEWKKVVSSLQIQPRAGQPLAGLVFVRMMENVNFMHSVDGVLFSKVQEKLTRYMKKPAELLKTICGETAFNLPRTADLMPTEIMLPSDIGLPIIVQVNMPVAGSVSGKVKIDCTKMRPIITMEVQTYFASQYLGRVGTVSPFHGEHIAVGLDEHTIVSLPVSVRVEADITGAAAKAVIQPLPTVRGPVDLLHYHVRPWAIAHKYYDFTPPTLISGIKFIKSNDPAKVSEFKFGDYLGLSLTSKLETEARYMDLKSLTDMLALFNYNPVNMLRFTWASGAISPAGTVSLRPQKYCLVFDPTKSGTKSIEALLTIGFASKWMEHAQSVTRYYMVKAKTAEEMQHSSLSLHKLNPYKIESMSMTEAAPVGAQHADHMTKAKEAIARMERSGAALKVGHVLTVLSKVTLMGARPRLFAQAAQIVIGTESGTDAKVVPFFWYAPKWHAMITSEQLGTSICIDGKLTLPVLPMWDIAKIQAHPTRIAFESVLGLGPTCSESRIVIKADTRASDAQKRMSMTSAESKMCNVEMANGYAGARSSAACEATRTQALTMDKMDIKVDYIHAPAAVIKTEVAVTKFLKTFLWTYLRLTPDQLWGPAAVTPAAPITGAAQRHVRANLVFKRLHNAVDATIKTPEQTIAFADVRLPFPLNVALPLVAGADPVVATVEKISGNALFPKCTLDKTMLRTFDHRVTTADVDSCWHLLAADCSAENRFGVMVRAVQGPAQEKRLEAEVFVGGHKLVIAPAPTYTPVTRHLVVTAVGQVLAVPKNEVKTIKLAGADIAVIVKKTSDEVVEVRSSDNTLRLRFDGERVSVQSLPLLRNRLCGLCGDQNLQKAADLRGPRQCVYSRPLMEVASYRVQTATCSALAAPIKLQFEKERRECAKFKEIPTKVQKSFEFAAGACQRKEHMILSRESNELCISRSPVLQCGPACESKPLKPVTKVVAFTCLTEGRLAEHYAQKARRGQEMPELLGKAETFSVRAQIPQSCQPIGS